MNLKAKNPFEYIMSQCMEDTRKKILVIYDKTTTIFLKMIQEAGKLYQKEIRYVEIIDSECHGVEPEAFVLEQMLRSDLVMCITHHSLAHTLARRRSAEIGIPFLSMPDYNYDMIKNEAHFVDYKKIYPSVKKYADILSSGMVVQITSEKGTNLCLGIEGRQGNCCPGIVNSDYLLGSPPDIEANVAPVEYKSNGVLVIDGSITDSRIGLLDSPMTLNISDGKIVDFISANKQNEITIKQIFSNVKSENAYYVGEFGIGFNDLATICGNMLIDEGTKGCIHFGMGSNWTIGGTNKVAFHLDFVMKDATVFVDDTKIIERGVLIYE